MNGISMETFRAIVGNQSIGADDKLAIGDEQKTTLVPGGAEHTISAEKTKDDSRYMRSQLLLQVGFALGNNKEVFDRIQDKLFVGVANGPDIACTPLSKREISEVIKMADEAAAAGGQGAVGAVKQKGSAPVGAAKTAPVKYQSPDWKTGVPKLVSGVVLRQSGGNNTCFACSVLNGIANSPKLAAHFESLVDRTKTPPTIKLFTDGGKREFRFDETFGLPEKTLDTIAGKSATELEKFFMRYLVSINDGYKPGSVYFDDVFAGALGLVRVGMGRLVDDAEAGTKGTVSWSGLVNHLKSGGCVTRNVGQSHFTSIIAADENGCKVADSLDGRAGRAGKSNAVKWSENTTLSFYDLPSGNKVDAFKERLGGFGVAEFKTVFGNLQQELFKDAGRLAGQICGNADYKGPNLISGSGVTVRDVIEYCKGMSPDDLKDPRLHDCVDKLLLAVKDYDTCRRWIGTLDTDKGPAGVNVIKREFEEFILGWPGGRNYLQTGFGSSPEEDRKYISTQLVDFVKGNYLGATSQIRAAKAAELHALRDIAGIAYGNGFFDSGKDGGEGYMALVDGKAVKFLTHGGERSDLEKGKVRLFNADRQSLRKATDDLKAKLTGIASKLAEERRARILELLNNEPAVKGVQLLSRKTVAKVISIIAEEVESFNWDDVKSVKSDADMSLDSTIFKNDPMRQMKLRMTNLTTEQRAFLKAEHDEYRKWYVNESKGGRTVDRSDIMKWKIQHALRTDYQEEVMRLFGNLLSPVQGDGVLREPNPSVQNEISMLKRVEADRSSASARVRATQKYGENAIGGFQIAADATFFGGTLTQGGQEEALFPDMPAMNIAYLLHEKYIELSNVNGDSLSVEEFCKDGNRRFKYSLDENGERKLKTWLGMGVPTLSYTTDGKPNADGEPRASWFVFTAATAFGTDTVNIDRGGFMEVLKHRDKKPLVTGDATSRRNADAFFDQIHNASYDLYSDDLKFLLYPADCDFGLPAANRWNALMILAHFYTGDKFNVFGGNPADEFRKLVELVRSGDYKRELDEAMESYKKLALLQNRLWRQLEDRLGMDYEAHTNPGGTFFANPPDVTLGAAGMAFKLDGGSTIHDFYVYGSAAEGEKINAAFKETKVQRTNPAT